MSGRSWSRARDYVERGRLLKSKDEPDLAEYEYGDPVTGADFTNSVVNAYSESTKDDYLESTEESADEDL